VIRGIDDVNAPDFGRVTVHGTDHPDHCATLLVDLNLHPRLNMQVFRHSENSDTIGLLADVLASHSRCSQAAR